MLIEKVVSAFHDAIQGFAALAAFNSVSRTPEAIWSRLISRVGERELSLRFREVSLYREFAGIPLWTSGEVVPDAAALNPCTRHWLAICLRVRPNSIVHPL